MRPTRTVPCGSCTLCCHGEAIVLHPEDGDKPEEYETDIIPHPIAGGAVHILKHRNGKCIYLGPFGCTIHARRPVICREFDCRGFYKRFTKKQMKDMVRAKIGDMKVWKRGRELVEMEKQDV